MRGLLLYASTFPKTTLSYNDDWKDAFSNYASFINWDQYNLASKTKSWLMILPKIKRYQIILLLHSTNSNGEHVHPILRKALLYRQSKLIVFIGNEYNKLAQEKLKLINDIDADVVASQLPQDIASWMYEDTKAQVISVPHALNPKIFKPITYNNDRRIDIGNRSFYYPMSLGDNNRNKLNEYFLKHYQFHLKMDISTDPSERFNRKGWASFLNSCKGTISTEAGTSFLEKYGTTLLAIRKYRKRYPEATFNDIYNKFYANYKNPVSGKLISSRHFDAVGTKTCQIMIHGRFSDIFEPEKNYISINRDFSNIKDAIERFKDDDYRNKIINDTYDYIMDCHTHRHRVEDLLKKIDLFVE